MKLQGLLAGAALLVLAGCSGREDGNAAANQVENAAAAEPKAAANDRLEPGLYEVTTTTAVSMPGMPAEAQQPTTETDRDCLTEEDTRNMAQTFMDPEMAPQCSRQSFTMQGGRMQGQLVCTQENQPMRAQIAGTYTADSYNVRMAMAGPAPGTQQRMTIDIRAQGRRVGQCPAEGAAQ